MFQHDSCRHLVPRRCQEDLDGHMVLINVGDLCGPSSCFCSGPGTYDLDPKSKSVDLPVETIHQGLEVSDG